MGKVRRVGKAAESFENLHIYQRSRELVNAIYEATRDDGFKRDFGLIDQIRRAAVSILSNIAEGFERGSKTVLRPLTSPSHIESLCPERMGAFYFVGIAFA